MFVGQNEIINLQVGPDLIDFIAPPRYCDFPYGLHTYTRAGALPAQTP